MNNCWVFTLSLVFDIIRYLGGLQIIEFHNVYIPKHEESLCTTIKINEPDLCAEFDPDKWFRGQNTGEFVEQDAQVSHVERCQGGMQTADMTR